MENMSEEVELDIKRVNTVSTGWVCEPRSSSIRSVHVWLSITAYLLLLRRSIESLQPGQVGRLIADLSPALDLQPTASIPFVQERLGELLSGQRVSSIDPPEALLAISCLSGVRKTGLPRFPLMSEQTISNMNADPYGQHFPSWSRRAYVRQTLASEFPSISEDIRYRVFPLYTPHTFDLHVYWEINSLDTVRSGCCVVRELCVGTGHEGLREVLLRAENAKENSMYAETQREKEALLGALQSSEWNLEMDPLVVKVRAKSAIVEHDFKQG
jgi:trafficking protein particle complex subunit 8